MVVVFLLLTGKNFHDIITIMELSILYKTTYGQEYQNQPKWKQLAINADLISNRSSSVLETFIKGVIWKAEKDFDRHLIAEKSPKPEVAKVTKVVESKGDRVLPKRF